MTVLIIQMLVKHYRVPFFEQLHRALLGDRIRLQVAYSKPPDRESLKGDNASLPPEIGMEVDAHWYLRNRLLYQPLLREISGADLIIVEQANKYLLNLLILGLSRSGLKKVAFWGHGRSWQGRSTTLSERIKRQTITWVDWWFAYTGAVRDYIVEFGFPAQRVTVVNNSVDTTTFERHLAEVTSHDLANARSRLGLTEHAAVGLFCGSLYPDKHLDFLLSSAIRIHQAIPNFHLVVIGGGTDSYKVEAAAQQHKWIHYLGPRFGREKATYFRLASIFLNPGLVGLAILDAFIAGLPMFTTNVPVHSPEVQYLENDVNGFMVEADLRRYADIVLSTISSPDRLERMRAGALKSARRYSIERMVENFRSGVVECLASTN